MGPDKQAGMAVGDVNSKEMGTGARANGDKPKWDLMPLDQIAKLVDQEPGLGRWLKVYTDPDLSDSHKPYMADKWHHSINAQMFRVLGLFQSGRIEAFELLQAATIYNWYYVKRIGNDQATMMDSLEPVIRVWEYGLIKYAEFNWAKGMPWTVPIGCISRHIKYHVEGDTIDHESGQLHSAHVVCNAMMLVHYEKYWKEGDDRPLFAFPRKSA